MAGSSASRKPLPTLAASPPPADPPAEPVLKALLDITKAELDTEFKISERLESKARTYFGFAVALFGITQAFVLRSDFPTLSASRHDRLEEWIIIACAGFGIALFGALCATLQRSDRNFDHMRIFHMARSADTQLDALAQEYAVLLGERRAANDKRLRWIIGTQLAATLSLALTAVEFVLAAIYFT